MSDLDFFLESLVRLDFKEVLLSLSNAAAATAVLHDVHSGHVQAAPLSRVLHLVPCLCLLFTLALVEAVVLF